MPVRHLPPNPSLDHLKYQAKDLLKGHAARDFEVAQRIREFHPSFIGAGDAEIFSARLRLADAQLAIAREYGFPSWARLKARVEKPTPSDQWKLPHHERIEDALFRRAVHLLDAGDTAGLRSHLKQHPNLLRQRVVFEGTNYFRNPTLLEFVAENPIRHGTLPANIIDITKLILDAGAARSALNETLGLVCSGRVPRECRKQIPLIDLLCDYGADANSAMQTALAHGEFEAVNALMQRGARTDLPVAAALGRAKTSHDCFRGPARKIDIVRLRWHHSLATLRSYPHCLMRAKIQTAITRSGSIPIPRPCIKPLWPDMTNSSTFSSSGAHEST